MVRKTIMKATSRISKRPPNKATRFNKQLIPRNISRPLQTQGMSQVTMRCRYGNLDTTGATQGVVFSYRINSLFEIDSANPLSRIVKYNEISGLYQKYRVYGCKATINMINTGLVRAQWCVMGTGANNNIDVFNDFPSQAVDEFGWLDVGGTTASNKQFVKYFNVTNLMSKTSGLSEAMEATPIGSNPSTSSFLRLGFKAAANTVIEFQIQLMLYSILLDPTPS